MPILSSSFVALMWKPGLNDPEPLGLVTFGAYLVAAVLCFRTAIAGREGRSRRAWFLLVAGLVLLGVNVQLDLHALLVEVLRSLSQEQGWYGQRRWLQHRFAVVFAAIVFVAGVALAYYFRAFIRRNWLVAAGCAMIGAYVVIRSAAFNHIDDRRDSVLERKNRLRLIEFSGVCAIGVAAWRSGRQGGGA